MYQNKTVRKRKSEKNPNTYNGNYHFTSTKMITRKILNVGKDTEILESSYIACGKKNAVETLENSLVVPLNVLKKLCITGVLNYHTT